jgi:hypothetical protein
MRLKKRARAPCAVGGDRDTDVRLAGARPADANSVALGFQEAAVIKVAHQDLVDRAGGEVELGQGLGQRQLGGPELVADGARLLLRDLGRQQIAQDLLGRALPLQAVAHGLVIDGFRPSRMTSS